MTRARRLQICAFCAAITVGCFAVMDGLSVSEPTAREQFSTETGDRYHEGGARAFVLIADSLRFQTPTETDLMPHLASMRATATSAKVKTVRDAVTVPALRAAFTGRSRQEVLGFVRNFLKGDEGIPSLLSQIADTGGRTAIYSEGSFLQFGSNVADRHPNEGQGPDEVTRQNRAVSDAFADFKSGLHDLVIAHVTYTDHIAHAHGIHHKTYRDHHRALDRVIEKIDRDLPANATFVVMGDHGHDERGRHAMGLDVPTYISLSGPGFRQGVDLGTIPIRDYRYLIGWAMKRPLPSDYRGGRHLRALVPAGADLPLSYRSTPDQPEKPPAGSGHTTWLVAAYLGLLGHALFVLARRDRNDPWQVLGLAALVALLFWSGTTPWILGVGLVLASIHAAWITRKISALRYALLAVGVAIGLHAWGLKLGHWRAAVHEPGYHVLDLVWAGALVAGLVAARNIDPARIAWALLALPAVLLWPTVYRYGWAATMGPAWSVGTVVIASAFMRRVAPDDRWRLRLAVPAVFLVAMFFHADATNFEFSGWYFPGFHVSAVIPIWLVVAAKIVIFAPRKPDGVGLAAAGAAVAFLTALRLRWIDPSPAMSLVILVGLAVAVRALSGEARRVLRRCAALAALFFAFGEFVRVDPVVHDHLDLLFCALVLTAAPLSALRSPSLDLWLGTLGLIACGWCTVAWTVHRLEWGFLYEYFDPAFVESEAGWFLPFILLRYAIPVVILRILIPVRPGALLAVAAAKLLALLAVATSLGSIDPGSDVYFEAVQEAGVLLVLMLGLL